MMGGRFVYIVGRFFGSHPGAIEIIDVCTTRKKAQRVIERSGESDLRVWCWQVDGDGEVVNDGGL